MAATTGTIGGTTSSPFTGAWAAGEDWSSAWQVDTALVANGRWDTGTGTWSVQKPFKVYSHYVTFRSGGSGTVSQRLATNAALSTGGTYQLKDSGTIDPDTDLTPAWNPGFLGLADVYYYGGFRMVSGASVLFYRAAGDDADMTTNNLIYQDGTSVSSWAGTSMYQTFSWYTVPNEPTSPTVTATTGTTASISWVTPTDNGGTAITGYRLMYKKSTDTWDQALCTGKFGTSATTTYTLTGLANGTTYNFLLAATNAVTDDHNTKDGLSYTSISAWVGTRTSAFNAVTTGGTYNGTAWVPHNLSAANASNVWATPSTAKVYNGSSWQDII